MKNPTIKITIDKLIDHLNIHGVNNSTEKTEEILKSALLSALEKLKNAAMIIIPQPNDEAVLLESLIKALKELNSLIDTAESLGWKISVVHNGSSRAQKEYAIHLDITKPIKTIV